MTTETEITPAMAARLLDDLTAIVARASAAIRELSPGSVATREKADRSPVTAADETAEAMILQELAQLLPAVPVVSEEQAAKQTPPQPGASFILVDPLDGTREFLAGRDEFTVNVAIITRNAPLAGVVAAPKRNLLWRGVVGKGAERLAIGADGAPGTIKKIHTRPWPAHGAIAFVSRSHGAPETDAFLARLGPVARNVSGSSIKFCLLAEGSADVYPRLAPTSEWDVAAGHAVLAAAGGKVIRPDETPLAYGNAADRFRIPAFVAWADPAKAASII